MRTMALVKRISEQMLRDKRTLALMMVAPLIILTLVHFLFTGDSAASLKLGLVSADHSLVQQLKEKDIAIIEYDHIEDEKQTIASDELDGLLQIEREHVSLTLKNEDPSKAKALQMQIQQTLASKAAKEQAAKIATSLHGATNRPSAGASDASAPQIDTAYVYGNADTSFFDVLSPILVGFFVFFFVFLISGIALLRERTTGTLDRLMSTPIRRGEIVAGYLLGYGLFAVLQTLIVVFYSVKVLGIVLVGSIWSVIVINLLLALVALSLGILLSAFANSEFQMVQFIPVVVIPQVFFAGIFPVEGMAEWLQIIARFMPMYYGGEALQAVMYKGLGLSDISSDLIVLCGFALFFIVLNVFALRKYRKI
ncbi:ABC transporter permease [Paenibacillus apiarius]|uniref:ABC transporter permease n=1 Tax=Paenibacillus apiarius TaxID=46240 RepID=A0ABT4DQR3_9BACL|nr:ABC transporter permease [Paenibacillus apiarius]MCY9516327.1 ABC transporter permease [Paenibacillus apiarius]MCY9519575.1 ABC transporter permease [Paenibacillus apiarius]MCY9554663.1 ABC transporter permease [Paenibacillus apiarius]MCY9561510.1 ABC transporter permease [Paenibacillus apiarius]MCY9684259.1 ABC transporter permease [Paenibacillus apiarius]